VLKRDEFGVPSFWQLQLLGWLAFYFVLILAVLPYRKMEEIRDQTIACVALFLASSLLRPVCRSLLRRSLPWLAMELRALAWSFAVGTVAAFVSELAILRVVGLVWIDLLENAVQLSVMLFLWCTLYLSIKLWQQSMRERERLLRAESEARDAHLSALRYQLNPHFLFNSLNAVSTLVLRGDATRATRMLAQISKLLRVLLEGPITAEIALSQELNFAKEYLAIEQSRLGEQLQVIFEIVPETLDAAVPNMLLQPLLENAVRHGVGRLRQGGVIAVRTAVESDRLLLIVRNSGPGRSADAAMVRNVRGVGLANTTERLHRRYGSEGELNIRWPEDGGCEITIRLPLHKLVRCVEETSCVL
jgi:two-component system, LytTR family, sensor kinase